MIKIGILYLSIAACLWGGMFVVSKFLLGLVSPVFLLSTRYFIAFFVLFIVLMLKKNRNELSKLNLKSWLALAAIGFIGYFFSIFCQFWGTQITDAHTASLITATTPVFAVFLSRFMLKEKLTPLKITAVLLASLGVVIIMGFKFSLNAHFEGLIILFLAAVTWALLGILVKILSKKLSSLLITTFACLFAFFYALPFSLSEHIAVPFQRPDLWAGLIYMGVFSTALAFFLWNKGLETVEAGKGTLFIFLQTIVGTLLGVIFLSEKITPQFFMGAFLILLGIVLVSLWNDQGSFLLGKKKYLNTQDQQQS